MTHPVPISTYVLPPSPNANPEFKVGCHQPAEQVYNSTHYVIRFSGGLRAVDVSNPYSPKKVGYYVPSMKTIERFASARQPCSWSLVAALLQNNSLDSFPAKA